MIAVGREIKTSLSCFDSRARDGHRLHVAINFRVVDVRGSEVVLRANIVVELFSAVVVPV